MEVIKTLQFAREIEEFETILVLLTTIRSVGIWTWTSPGSCQLRIGEFHSGFAMGRRNLQKLPVA